MKKKILVVDDDQAVLTYLLVKLGARYDLVTTDAGDQVMRLVKKEMPDLIVCDIDMPDVDGGDISAQLYGDDKTRYIPMLFLSALVPAKDAKRGEVGGRPAISKSAPIDELIARIESLMV
ncbi:MAG TPA: response regulator [Burkholderiales bacterium]|jgi:CheY-like chemotaxis protein